MTTAALPVDRWELTAPETYLLRYVDCRPRPIDVFTLALKELVARGALCLGPARIPGRLGIGTRTVWLLTDGPALATVTEPALTVVVDLYEGTRRRRGVDGVLLDDLRRRGARYGFQRYVRRDVAGALCRRGLLTDDRRRTAAGCRADDDLEAWLTIGRRRFPLWATDRRDPGQAVAYLVGAGAAVLLIPEAYPGLARLGDRIHAAPYDQALLIWSYDTDLDAAFSSLDAGPDILGDVTIGF